MNESLTQLPAARRWRGQTHPVPVVAAIIHRLSGPAPAFLLIRRIQPPYAGKWALVGGRWEFGETLSQAVIREVWEETGLAVGAVSLRCFADERLFPHQADDFGAHFAMFIFEVRAFSGEPREQTEGQVGWFSDPQLNELLGRQEIVPTDYQILKHCQESSQALPYIEVEVIAQDSGTRASRLQRFDTIA
jgi:8-oxo-dGTP diphosphatase